MIYDTSNAQGAKVYDIERSDELKRVLWIDGDKGEVVRANDPAFAHNGELVTFTDKFRTVFPIWRDDAKTQVQEFHCYGRM